MKRLFVICIAILATIGLSLVTHPLQSDGNRSSCDVDVECIGRIPYHEPLMLVNPVKGCSRKSIGSIWGDSRDHGKRKHEGMDIFAPRGTCVVAPIDGIVKRVGWNVLGGKVIWIVSRKTQHAYYFAHLSTYNVCVGDTVNQGEVIGTVGTTGNARFTSPHLHFGIYALNRRFAMRREVIWREG